MIELWLQLGTNLALPQRMHSILRTAGVSALFVLGLGCHGDGQVWDPPGGKADTAGDCGDSYGEESACTCEAQGDQLFCIFGGDTRELAHSPHLEVEQIGAFFELSEADALELEQLQIGVATENNFDSLEEMFELVDDEGVEVVEISYLPTGDRFTFLRMFFGSTEVGYIFREGTTELVAFVGDQDVNDCTVHLPAELDHRCGATELACSSWDAHTTACADVAIDVEDCFDFAPYRALEACCDTFDRSQAFCQRVPELGECLFGSFFPHAEETGAFRIMRSKELTASTVTEQQEKQILKGVQALGRNPTTATEAFAFADGGVMRVRTMVSEVSDHDAFTHYAYNDGENPMGFIFTMDSLELVAVIGDDSVSDCTVVR